MGHHLTDTEAFLRSVHPYDSLSPSDLKDTEAAFEVAEHAAGETVYAFGAAIPGLYLIVSGEIEITDANGVTVSVLGPRNSFGERGLMRDGRAVTAARALSDARLLILPKDHFESLLAANAAFSRYFDRARPTRSGTRDLAEMRLSDLMTPNPLSCSPDTSIHRAAQAMSAIRASCIAVTVDKKLAGILTTRDMTTRVVAKALPMDTPVSEVMTADPVTLSPEDLGSDVLQLMMERGMGHVPVTSAGALVGIITQTDLTRYQAVSSAVVISDIAKAKSVEELVPFTRLIPQVLAQLVAAGKPHDVITRLITDIGDAVTRRLLKLAEDALGAPPAPYLWLACGSQGRREQTGVSDQDNCLMLSDAVGDDDMPYFAELAKFVSDGLDACGYFYCPGDMMATNPRWCQPVRVWRRYFEGWIARPDGEAQMLASVMFDLRPIAGDETLFAGLQEDVLAKASRNSIFVGHMIANSLKHQPPLGLLRGFATIRSGEHKNTIDLKHNGVVPVVDLGRVYALRGRLTAANTRARLLEARAKGVLSETGAKDLIDAYDLIAESRLEHQAFQIKHGTAPNNFMAPTALSDFERGHLRDAFVVVRTMQSAIGQGKGALG
jgi:CBS domain-containing protein